MSFCKFFLHFIFQQLQRHCRACDSLAETDTGMPPLLSYAGVRWQFGMTFVINAVPVRKWHRT